MYFSSIERNIALCKINAITLCIFWTSWRTLYRYMCVRGWARIERKCRSLPHSTLLQKENLSANYSQAIKALLWVEISKANSSFEQAVSSNIQYPEVYWSLCIGCFFLFLFLLRSFCIRFHWLLSMPCFLIGATNFYDRSRWGVNKPRNIKGHNEAFLSPPALKWGDTATGGREENCRTEC